MTNTVGRGRCIQVVQRYKFGQNINNTSAALVPGRIQTCDAEISSLVLLPLGHRLPNGCGKKLYSCMSTNSHTHEPTNSCTVKSCRCLTDQTDQVCYFKEHACFTSRQAILCILCVCVFDDVRLACSCWSMEAVKLLLHRYCCQREIRTVKLETTEDLRSFMPFMNLTKIHIRSRSKISIQYPEKLQQYRNNIAIYHLISYFIYYSYLLHSRSDGSKFMNLSIKNALPGNGILKNINVKFK